MRGRVLVAHPETAERDRIVAAVRAAGLEPLEAADGESALAHGRDTVLALISPGLTRGDGLSVAARLRERGRGQGPAVVLLNDVYPVAQPSDRFLKEFGLSEALTWPASARDLSELLGRFRKIPKRPAREKPKSIDLTATPMLRLLATCLWKQETAFIYAHRDDESMFLVLAKGDVARIRSNQGETATGEAAMLRSLLTWTTGSATVIRDPAIEETSTGRLPTIDFLDEAVAPPFAPERLRALAVGFPDDAIAELAQTDRNHLERIGLGLFERQVMEWCDGERTVARVRALAAAGAIPWERVILRLETLGVVRAVPATERARSQRTMSSPAPTLLPPRSALIGDGGLLDPGDLARLLLRLELRRESGVLAVKRGQRTIEIAIANGRITGANAWGEEKAAGDPIARLAESGGLTKADVPFLRRLHWQRLLIENLRSGDVLQWSLRRNDRPTSEGPGLAGGSLVAELLRDGDIELPTTPLPSSVETPAIAAALGLTAREARFLLGESASVAPRWLGAMGTVLDTAGRIGRPTSERHLALAGEVAADRSGDELEQMFDRALGEGLREGVESGARRAIENPAEAIGISVGGERGSHTAFTLEQGANGVMIRVGERAYGIDALIAEVEELRSEKSRLRAELRRRHDLLEERSHETEAVRRTSHEIENVVADLQSMLKEREVTIAKLELRAGEMGARCAEAEAVLPEKERILEELRRRLEGVESERASTRTLIGKAEQTITDLRRDRNRSLDDLRSERDGFRDRAQSIETELQALQEELAKAEELQRVANLHAERAEQDLQLARRDRDELTARLANQATADLRRRPIREARGRPGDDAPADMVTQRVAEERRLAMEAMRRESVEMSHRVIDIEGQLARREAETARHRRERERLEARLAETIAESQSRAENERAHRDRWEKSERLLAEKTTTLEVREQELKGLRRQLDERTHEGERLRSVITELQSQSTRLGEERTELRTKLKEFESEGARLRGELERALQQADELQGRYEDSRVSAEKSASALETVRTTREELAARLTETLTTKNRVEEERERLAAESKRLSEEFRRERDARSEERAGLQGKLEAREEELNRLEQALTEARHALGGLRDKLPALEVERNDATHKSEALDREASRLREEVTQLNRVLRDGERSREQLAQEHRRLGEELASTRGHGEQRIRELEQVLGEARSELESATQERAETRASLESEITEQTALLERARAELAHVRESGSSEIATWKARAQRFEERVEQLVAEQDESQKEIALRQQDVERLDEQMNNARKRVAQDMRRLSELVAFTEELKGRVAEREQHIARLEGDIAARTRAIDEVNQNLTTRTHSESALRKSLATSDGTLTELRHHTATLETRSRTLSAKLQAVEAQATSFKSALDQVRREKTEAETRLRDETVRAKREAQTLGRALAETEAELNKARDDSRKAMVGERQLRALYAKRDAEAPATTRTPQTVELARHAKEMAVRLAALEEEGVARVADQVAQKKQVDQLTARLLRAEHAARSAKSEQAETGERLAELERELKGRELTLAKLSHDLADANSSLEMRDLVLAEADVTISERDETIAALRSRVDATRAELAKLNDEVKRHPTTATPPLQIEQALRERDLRIHDLERRLMVALGADSVKPPLTQSAQATQRPAGRPAAVEAALGASPERAANDDARSGVSKDLMARRAELLVASNSLNRVLNFHRDELESKSGDLAAVDDLMLGDLNQTERTRLETRRVQLEKEVHETQARLGTDRVKMAAINQEIQDLNRQLQGQADRKTGP